MSHATLSRSMAIGRVAGEVQENGVFAVTPASALPSPGHSTIVISRAVVTVLARPGSSKGSRRRHLRRAHRHRAHARAGIHANTMPASAEYTVSRFSSAWARRGGGEALAKSGALDQPSHRLQARSPSCPIAPRPYRGQARDLPASPPRTSSPPSPRTPNPAHKPTAGSHLPRSVAVGGWQGLGRRMRRRRRHPRSRFGRPRKVDAAGRCPAVDARMADGIGSRLRSRNRRAQAVRTKRGGGRQSRRRPRGKGPRRTLPSRAGEIHI